jgi:hypothetical protein
MLVYALVSTVALVIVCGCPAGPTAEALLPGRRMDSGKIDHPDPPAGSRRAWGASAPRRPMKVPVLHIRKGRLDQRVTPVGIGCNAQRLSPNEKS